MTDPKIVEVGNKLLEAIAEVWQEATAYSNLYALPPSFKKVEHFAEIFSSLVIYQKNPPELNLCKHCRHAKPPYDTSREWRDKAICHSPNAKTSPVDGEFYMPCFEHRLFRDADGCADGKWFEPI